MTCVAARIRWLGRRLALRLIRIRCWAIAWVSWLRRWLALWVVRRRCWALTWVSRLRCWFALRLVRIRCRAVAWMSRLRCRSGRMPSWLVVCAGRIFRRCRPRIWVSTGLRWLVGRGWVGRLRTVWWVWVRMVRRIRLRVMMTRRRNWHSRCCSRARV